MRNSRKWGEREGRWKKKRDREREREAERGKEGGFERGRQKMYSRSKFP